MVSGLLQYVDGRASAAYTQASKQMSCSAEHIFDEAGCYAQRASTAPF